MTTLPGPQALSENGPQALSENRRVHTCGHVGIGGLW
jgi:hypothetical protein